MRLPLQGLIDAAFLGALLILASLSVVSWRSLKVSEASTVAVERAHRELALLENAVSELRALESAVRGYVITGHEAYLEPAAGAEAEIASAFSELRRLAADPVEVARLDAVQPIVEERIGIARGVQELRAKDGEAAAERAIATQRGRILMNEVLSRVGRLEVEVRARMARRKALEAESIWQAQAAMVAGNLVAFLLLAVTGWQVRRDLGRRRAIKEELERTRTYLDSVIENMPVMVFVKEAKDLRFVSFNKAGEQLLGMPRADLIGKCDYDFFPREQADFFTMKDRSVLNGRMLVDIPEEPIDTKSGRRLLHTRKIPILSSEGEPLFLLGVSEDITDLKRAQERVAESERVLRQFLDALPVGVFILDGEGRPYFANRESARLLGRGPVEGLPLERLTETYAAFAAGTDRTYPVERLPIVRALKGESSVVDDLEVQRPEGRVPLEVMGTPVRDSEGKVLYAIAAFVDISDRKRAAAALEAARDAALDLARAKSEFLANMSHEIRTPMNAIIGMTGILLESGLTARQREFAQTVQTAGDALLGVINDILDFSKMEAGKLVLDDEPFELVQAIEESAELVAAKAAAKDLELAVSVHAGLPARARGDGQRLRQVMINLLANAVKFTERGEVVLSAEASGEGRARRLRVSVRDTGIGMTPEARGRLFSAFTQADASTTRRFGGTGLGLAISKQIVDAMGGGIGCESEPGKGSTFWFEVPLREEAGPARHDGRAHVGGRQVLVVDDNATNRRILRHQLEARGIEVQEAATGEAALAAAAGDRAFDAVLTDMNMPGIDGLEVARRLRAAGGPPVLMLTSLGKALGDPALAEAGIAACLTKPVRERALFEALARALGVEAAPAKAGAAATAELARGTRVLLAEDNPVNRKVALLQLERLGCRTVVAEDGKAAVDAASGGEFDVVLMDCQMPVMDGYAAAGAIRRLGRGRHVPVIAMTANALEGDRERCLAAGMDDHLAKPVRPEALAVALARWTAAVDPSAIEDLRALGGPESPDFIKAIASEFLSEAERVGKEVGGGASPEDLARTAHRLRGSSGQIGARRLSAVCARIEAAKGAAAEGDVEVLKTELGRVVDYMKALA